MNWKGTCSSELLFWVQELMYGDHRHCVLCIMKLNKAPTLGNPGHPKTRYQIWDIYLAISCKPNVRMQNVSTTQTWLNTCIRDPGDIITKLYKKPNTMKNRVLIEQQMSRRQQMQSWQYKKYIWVSEHLATSCQTDVQLPLKTPASCLQRKEIIYSIIGFKCLVTFSKHGLLTAK